MIGMDNAPLETSEREAVDIPVPAGRPAGTQPSSARVALLAAVELCVHLGEAFEGKFPTHPKPVQSWWEALAAHIETTWPLLMGAIRAAPGQHPELLQLPVFDQPGKEAGATSTERTSMSTPTIGQKAKFYPHSSSSDTSPKDAKVTQVWGPACVNLEYLDDDGRPHPASSVPIPQQGFPAPEGYYCVLEPAEEPTEAAAPASA